MSTTTENEVDPRVRKRVPVECKPLLDAATKDLFRKNVFRITGRSVDESTPEITKHADKLMLRVKYGHDSHTQNAPFPIKPPPSWDEIHVAIKKLNEPEERLIDEFFWFWPEEFGQSKSDPAIQALAEVNLGRAIDIWEARENDGDSGIVAKHNLALVHHVWALDGENRSVKTEVVPARRQKITSDWQGAFDRWEQLATNEAFWGKITARIHQLNVPNLRPGFARRMRDTLPGALGKINAELALTFAESGQMELARLHIRFMRETNQGLYDVEKISELVLTPAKNRLQEQIRRSQERAEKNPHDAAIAAQELIQQAQRALSLFDLFFGRDSDLRNDLFDKVSSVCNRLQIDYHNSTKDDQTCLAILEAVLAFATSTELRQSIETDISETCAKLRFKKLESVYALLKSIQDSQESPSVRLARFERDAIPAIVNAAGISGFSPNCGYHFAPAGDCKDLFEDMSEGVDTVEDDSAPAEDCEDLFDGMLDEDEETAARSSISGDYDDLFDCAAIVLRGISLDAWIKHQDRRTAVAANKLAIQHAVSPETKQGLAEDKTTLQQRETQRPAPPATQREKSNIAGVFGLVVVAVFIVCGVIGSFNSTNNPPRSTSYTPPPAPSASASTTPRKKNVFDTIPIEETTQSAPAYTVKSGDTLAKIATEYHITVNAIQWANNLRDSRIKVGQQLMLPAKSDPLGIDQQRGDSGGNVYRVPSSVSRTLENEGAAIESNRAALEVFATQVAKLGREIESDRLYLDRTSQSAIDEFNDKVERYNALHQQAKNANAAFNARVNSYNAKLQQYGR